MKVILYTALTINGKIAKKDGSTHWVSDLKEFNQMCKKIGAVVVGRKTWDEMNPDWLPYPEGQGLYIVLTHIENLKNSNPKTIFTSSPPIEIIKLVQDLGRQEIIVIGGGETYGTFLKSAVVDEIYVSVEPYIFGQGIRFFPESDFEMNLKLLESKNLSDQTIQLHYKVNK